MFGVRFHKKNIISIQIIKDSVKIFKKKKYLIPKIIESTKI